MKSIITCLIFLLFAGTIEAQTIVYQPVHGDYTQYVYRHQHWNGSENVEWFHKTIWSGDTTINGENYTRIFQYGTYYGGVREDLANQQRYFLNGNVEYNITISPFLAVGTILTDSSIFLNAFRTYLDIYVEPDYDTLMIAGVDSILEANGDYSTTYHLECLPQPNVSFVFNTYRGLLDVNGFEFNENQICYREDGEQTPPGQETPWTIMCDLGIDENTSFEVSISPNPAANSIELSGKNFSLIEELAIYDLNGVLVKKIPPSEINTRISLEELESGVYLLALNGNSKILRLIKQ